ncbi:hypothetical protein VTK73DRAFT_2326 [Phialemonium thermophilum]|uniref:Major facilitator superfamily (MFS) profile domain-containing protein n=1 Tax=Phialemonium thermophilum TaxID=223376 RepID=A0ABR3VSB2_9PEZI
MGQEQSPEVVVVVDVAQCEAATTDPPVETLGRKRPAIFPSAMAEVLFCFSIMQSALMADYFVSGFSTVLPALSLSLDIPEDARTWPSSVLSLVAGALLLPLGRLADMYGGSVVFNAGFVWFTVWGLVAGFSTNATMLVVCRAMEGLGTACIMPSGITLLGKAYRPGPRKNFVFALAP